MTTVAFGCQDGLSVLLGSFDGRDRRTLFTHALAERPAQLLVSMHEQLHEELHWSTAWGVTSAMAGLLAKADVRAAELSATATDMNAACSTVHELFATTVSCGAVGVPAARMLLADNPLYLGYLNDGLALGGSSEVWPWQFRESAIQMLLRTLMQPAELADLAEAGLGHLTPRDISDVERHPNVRLGRIRDESGGWWSETFREILDAHPDRGGDTGGLWERHLPGDPDAMERLKAWEETVLIPALGATARRHLLAAGIAVLDQREYLEAVAALRASFLELAPDDWQVEVFTERHPMSEEMLGAEREALALADGPALAVICEADELPGRAVEFLLQGPDGPHVLAAVLDRAVLRRQFAGIEEIPINGPPLLAMIGPPTRSNDRRGVPIALMRPDVTPRALGAMFSSVPVIILSTLRASLDDHARDQLLELDEAYVLVDLPLRTQIAAWIEQAGRVRLRVTDVTGATPMNLIVLQIDGLASLWLLSFRSDAGIGELAQLLDRHPGALTADLDIPPRVVQRIGMLAAWLHGAWWSLEEVPG